MRNKNTSELSTCKKNCTVEIDKIRTKPLEFRRVSLTKTRFLLVANSDRGLKVMCWNFLLVGRKIIILLNLKLYDQLSKDVTKISTARNLYGQN